MSDEVAERLIAVLERIEKSLHRFPAPYNGAAFQKSPLQMAVEQDQLREYQKRKEYERRRTVRA